MTWAVYVFGSGLAFLIGAGFIVTAIAIRTFQNSSRPGVTFLCAAIGLIFVTLSATPLPIWFYVVLITSTIAWLAVPLFGPQVNSRPMLIASIALAFCWLGGIVHECPYQRLPTMARTNGQTVYLFGDSLSAQDAGASTDAWPTILAENHQINIVNLARPGATVANALDRAVATDLGPGIVLLEIGGNDLLGSTDANTFSENLDKLLQRVQGEGRQIVMFELPLFPFRGEFGRIQRRLASKYGALLVPKRILISVLTGPGATLDTIHLSAAGHERMAETVWTIIEPAYNRHLP